MKLSYKIALIVSAALLLVAVILINGSGGSGEETTETADNSAAAGQNQRKSLVSESSEPGADGSEQTDIKPTVDNGTSKPTSSLAADIRRYQQQAAAEKAATEKADSSPVDGSPTTTAAAEEPVDESAKANTPEAIALNRTDADAGKPVVIEEPKKTSTISRAELDAILGGGSTTPTNTSTPDTTTTSGANTSLSTAVIPVDTSPSTAGGYPGGTYVIQAGDTFSLIADRVYGDESKWDVIAQANPRVDPIRLQVGQEVRIPALADATVVRDANEPDKPLPEGVRIHVVQAGDSLSTISEKYYDGDATQWRKIYNFNRDLIGKNPNAIKAGMELRIPPPVNGAR